MVKSPDFIPRGPPRARPVGRIACSPVQGDRQEMAHEEPGMTRSQPGGQFTGSMRHV
jgi:hypothetical protein